MLKKIIYPLFVFICVAALSAQAEETTASSSQQLITNDDCLACHDQFNLEKFKTSIHGSNQCTSCHGDIKEIPHPEKLAKVQCSSCHDIEAQIYYSSDHGKALKKGAPAAQCLDCHGEPHSLLNSRDQNSPVNRLNIHKTCARCHEDEKKMEPFHLLEKAPFKSYAKSVHGIALIEKGITSAAVCTDCHGSHDLHAPTNPNSKIYRRNVPQTCGKCHENVLRTYERSIHGKAALAGKLEAPVCTDCHGEHTIKAHTDPESSVYPTQISEKTCGHCHAAEKIITKYKLPPNAVKTYLESFHGLASKFGNVTVANCASCHGAHDVLPSSDPNSSVSKQNLPKTCGKCHPGVGDKLARGTIHVVPTSTENSAVYYVTVFYIILIVLTIGGMIFHNFIDFIAKLKKHYEKNKTEAKYVRYSPQERIQHRVLILSFVVLAYTGFALEYPEAWWAAPFKMIPGGGDWRGIIHRTAAILFVALTFHHLFFLLIMKRGKKLLKEMKPMKNDVSDLINTIRFNLGLSKEKPSHVPFNYVEKTEYWALVWGSAIMILTGTMLTFENFFMTHLPKWAIDVVTKVHFYEAVLATSAIIVWHFYFVIFDPDVYPMNWSMRTGKVKEEEKKIE